MIQRYSMWCAVSHGHQMTPVDMGQAAPGGFVTWEDHCNAIAPFLCEGCPEIGYPTDETRCTPCPRRPSTSAKPGVT